MADDLEDRQVPDELLPSGVGPAWYDEGVLRAAAEAHNRHPWDREMTIKSWVVLDLLNRAQSNGLL